MVMGNMFTYNEVGVVFIHKNNLGTSPVVDLVRYYQLLSRILSVKVGGTQF